MRSFLLVITFASITCAAEKAVLVTFGKADLGKFPDGWLVAKTGEGEGSVWKVLTDDTVPSKTGHALTQTAAGPNRLFNVCVWNAREFRDCTITVNVHAISGEIDQGGGLVWRYVDANNYYVCRFNPLEKNFRLYSVKDGKRKELASKEKIELKNPKLFSITVRHVGDKITCELARENKLEATDDTFSKAGKIGLWTKADAVTSFDSLGIIPK